MRRIRQTAALVLALLMLCACAQEQPEDTAFPQEALAAVVSSQEGLPPLTEINAGDEEFSRYLTVYFELDPEVVTDGVIACADGVQASEIDIFVMDSASRAKEVEEAMNAYIERRAEEFAGYAPEQAAMAQRGVAAVNGRYAALLICPDPEAAKQVF